MKRLTMIGAAVLSAALLLTACGDTAQKSTATDTSAVSEAVSKVPETPEKFQAAMVSRSLYSLGNTSRLKAKLRQAQSGEDMTVAPLPVVKQQVLRAAMQSFPTITSQKNTARAIMSNTSMQVSAELPRCWEISDCKKTCWTITPTLFSWNLR